MYDLGGSDKTPSLVPAAEKRSIQGLHQNEILFGEYRTLIEKDVKCEHNMVKL
jgi:hypothetical protein